MERRKVLRAASAEASGLNQSSKVP